MYSHNKESQPYKIVDIDYGLLTFNEYGDVKAFAGKVELPIALKKIDIFFDTTSKERSPSSKQKDFLDIQCTLIILGIFFFVVYFILGITIIFWESFPILMETKYRIALGVILIVYAMLRFLRFFNSNRRIYTKSSWGKVRCLCYEQGEPSTYRVVSANKIS